MRKVRLTVVGVAAASLVLAGCASDRDGGPDASSTTSADGGATTAEEVVFTFASSNDPASLDPAFASDGESFRVARQMFEGLVGTVPGTADPARSLPRPGT